MGNIRFDNAGWWVHGSLLYYSLYSSMYVKHFIILKMEQTDKSQREVGEENKNQRSYMHIYIAHEYKQ